MSVKKSLGKRYGRLAVVAVFCALPFCGAGLYASHCAGQVDAIPLDRYAGLRWMPGRKGLSYLHLALNQEPPAKTELWRVDGVGSTFRQIGEFSAGETWTLTKDHSKGWVVLRGEKAGEAHWILSNGSGKVKEFVVEAGRSRLKSQGEGLFFESVDQDLPFEQFAEVERMPEPAPSPYDESEDWPEEVDEVDEVRRDEYGAPLYDEHGNSLEEEDPYQEEDPYREDLEDEADEILSVPATQSGLNISEYDPEETKLNSLFSIPYSRDEDKPLISLIRRSPDKRFLALVVRFGMDGKPGLWLFDSENKRLLWTRVLVEEEAYGLDWSSDSVSLAMTDSKGLVILDKALDIESKRLEINSTSRLRPTWGAGRRLFLVSADSIYTVSQKKGTAAPTFSSKNLTGDVSELVLDPLGGRVAFSSSHGAGRELIIRDLKTKQNLAKTPFPGSAKRLARGKLFYQLGSALRHAWSTWTGRG